MNHCFPTEFTILMLGQAKNYCFRFVHTEIILCVILLSFSIVIQFSCCFIGINIKLSQNGNTLYPYPIQIHTVFSFIVFVLPMDLFFYYYFLLVYNTEKKIYLELVERLFGKRKSSCFILSI